MSETKPAAGWATVHVEDTCDGLLINADDMKRFGLREDVQYEGHFLPDGRYRIAIPMAPVDRPAYALTSLMEENAELKAALDAREIESGLTRDGNLWRFWSQKAKDVATKLSAEETRASELAERVSQLEQELDAAPKGNVVPFFLFWREVKWANAAYDALVKIAVDNDEARRFLESAIPRGPTTSGQTEALVWLLNHGCETTAEAREPTPLDREMGE